MKLTAKITRVRRKHFTSLRMSIVSYHRDPYGRPRHKIIAAFPTVRSSDVGIRAVQIDFWQRVNKTLLKLLVNNAGPNQIDAIRRRFEEIVPVPVTNSLPVAPPEQKQRPSAIETRFPFL